jgi:hypothetical protein
MTIHGAVGMDFLFIQPFGWIRIIAWGRRIRVISIWSPHCEVCGDHNKYTILVCIQAGFMCKWPCTICWAECYILSVPYHWRFLAVVWCRDLESLGMVDGGFVCAHGGFLDSVSSNHRTKQQQAPTLSNSSIKQTPLSANTRAPASNVHSLDTGCRWTYAVRPTADAPCPVVNTTRGAAFSTYLRNCDLAVPGSPHARMLMSPRTLCLSPERLGCYCHEFHQHWTKARFLKIAWFIILSISTTKMTASFPKAPIFYHDLSEQEIYWISLYGSVVFWMSIWHRLNNSSAHLGDTLLSYQDFWAHHQREQVRWLAWYLHDHRSMVQWTQRSAKKNVFNRNINDF